MRDSEDFTVAVRRGASAGTPSLVAHVYPDSSRDAAPLVGFVVSKAVGVAVERNRVKRRLRHLMREHAGRLPLGSRVVVRALPAAAGLSSSVLAADLISALQRAGAL
jgi:ribonuclease P protein component